MVMLSSSAFQQEARETKITHILRQGTWQGRHHQLCRRKVITHFLRSIHGKVVIRHHQHCRKKTMPRDHAQPTKGTWQSCCRQHCTGSTMPRDHAQTEKGTRQSCHHQHCSREPMSQDHTQSKGKWQVVIISITAGSSCHKITNILRRGHGRKVVVISFAAGSSCDDITHRLRRGEGKVVIISIVAGRPRDEITHHLEKEHARLSPSAL